MVGVALPITLLQLFLHPTLPFDPVLTASNIAVCHAVYDADRGAPLPPPRRRASRRWRRRPFTRATVAAAPRALTLALHDGYARVIKPRVAAAKPYVVALLWTVLVYWVPLLHAHVEQGDRSASRDPPRQLLPLLCGAEPRGRPARPRGGRGGRADAGRPHDAARGGARVRGRVGGGGGAAARRVRAPFPAVRRRVKMLGVSAMCYPAGRWAYAAAGGVFALAFVDAHDVELLSALLRSTEGVHALGVDLATTGIEWAFTLPEPFRTACVHALMTARGRGGRVRAGDPARVPRRPDGPPALTPRTTRIPNSVARRRLACAQEGSDERRWRLQKPGVATPRADRVLAAAVAAQVPVAARPVLVPV